MKNWHMVFLPLLFVFALTFTITGNNLVYADDHEKYENYGGYGEHREGGKGEEGPYEEVGKNLGWGTVIAMGAAGVIFIMRRSIKSLIANFPESKNIFISISKFFGKYHILIGVIALALSIFHGAAMFLSEGELEKDGMIGLGSVVLMAIASIMGAVLFKKKKLKSLRTTHTALIGLAIVIGLVHIVGA